MNKQELIEAVTKLPVDASGPRPKIDHLTTLELIKLLDEPQKPVVPQFVAEYIKYARSHDWDLQDTMDSDFIAREEDGNFSDWFYTDDNMELFAQAWLDGYEVEKEKRYRISMPRARNHKNHAQILCEKDEKIFWCGEWYPFRTKFTRKQLEEAGFGWVLYCPGIEIEEVEE